MKKLMTLLAAAFAAVMLALPAAAADVPADEAPGYDTAQILGECWGYDNYPDYVSGYWLDEAGVLNVGLVDETKKDEVLALVGGGVVNFVTHSYSYAELKEVQQAIEPYFEEDVGIMTAGVDQSENVLVIGVDMEHPNAAAFVEEVAALYGDRVTFESKEGLTIEYTVGNYPPGAQSVVPSRGLTPGQVVTAVGVIGLAGAFWLLLRSRRMARGARIASGGVISAAPTVTRKETETAVKNLTAEPDIVLKDIVEKLEE